MENKKENTVTFRSQLISHDWSYQRSDDHRYWSRGERQRNEINATYYRLKCPFSLGDLVKWRFKMIVEDFTEVEPDCWFRLPKKYKHMAPERRDGLIERSRFDEIERWMEENDTAE
jgi:hypothetical protein